MIAGDDFLDLPMVLFVSLNFTLQAHKTDFKDLLQCNISPAQSSPCNFSCRLLCQKLWLFHSSLWLWLLSEDFRRFWHHSSKFGLLLMGCCCCNYINLHLVAAIHCLHCTYCFFHLIAPLIHLHTWISIYTLTTTEIEDSMMIYLMSAVQEIGQCHFFNFGKHIPVVLLHLFVYVPSSNINCDSSAFFIFAVVGDVCWSSSTIL